MIDHLIKADSEEAMIALVGAYLNLHVAATEDEPARWRQDISFPCKVIDRSDPESPVALPYFYLWVALPEIDETLAGLPECVIVADRAAAERGESFVLWATLPATELDVYSVEPVIAGSNYPFGRV